MVMVMMMVMVMVLDGDEYDDAYGNDADCKMAVIVMMFMVMMMTFYGNNVDCMMVMVTKRCMVMVLIGDDYDDVYGDDDIQPRKCCRHRGPPRDREGRCPRVRLHESLSSPTPTSSGVSVEVRRA